MNITEKQKNCNTTFTKAVDEKIKQEALRNKWLGNKPKTVKDIEAKYFGLTRYSDSLKKDGSQYPPTCNVKVMWVSEDTIRTKGQSTDPADRKDLEKQINRNTNVYEMVKVDGKYFKKVSTPDCIKQGSFVVVRGTIDRAWITTNCYMSISAKNLLVWPNHSEVTEKEVQNHFSGYEDISTVNDLTNESSDTATLNEDALEFE